MRRIIYTLLAGLLLSMPLYSASNPASTHLSMLEFLTKEHLAYDSVAPIDSVIAWGIEAEPFLEQQDRIEILFHIKQQRVYLYSISGKVGEAVDEARQMYEKAEKMNYELGIALSGRAIGDAYHCSNMPRKAIEAYKEALKRFSKISVKHNNKEVLILKLASTLLQEGEIEEAQKYRAMLCRYQESGTDTSLRFFTLTFDACYYANIRKLQEAQECVQEAEAIYQQKKHLSFLPILNYAKACYYEASGNYKQSLEYYDKILSGIPQKTTSIDYLKVAYNKARLLTRMNQKVEACKLYQEIDAITDAIVGPSYSHRINQLRATYQVNWIEIENQTERNQIFMGGIIASFTVLGLIIFLTFGIKRKNKQLHESGLRLEESRKKAENAIRTKSLFLSNMSHEIRTPLNALSGFSTLLTEPELDEETRRQCNEIIQQNSDLLLKLINDVIDLSNLELGNMKFQFGMYDAITICNNVIDTVNKVKQTQAEVVFQTSLESLRLYTDDSRLQQLLINLLINATKFTPTGTISLELQKESDTLALFTITDTGCGIPLEKQKNIFNRFEKLNENAQGTGLGLSICQLIIERIGGKIWIDPEYTQGCRFRFIHPIDPVEKRKEETV